MTRQDIIQNNILIAANMGYKFYRYEEYSEYRAGWWKYPALKTTSPSLLVNNHNLARNHPDLKFHKEWDWIMKAIIYISVEEKWSINQTFEHLAMSYFEGQEIHSLFQIFQGVVKHFEYKLSERLKKRYDEMEKNREETLEQVKKDLEAIENGKTVKV